jgi:catechol 2,3-dioxygenase-like lactoylglutathione lyase family enzyme
LSCYQGDPNSDTDEYALEQIQQAHVEVCALLAHADKATDDPLDASQWQFFVLPAKIARVELFSSYLGTVTVMKPRITLLTLGVDDLQKSVEFYRDGLGLPTEGIMGTEFENGAVAFFELQAGLKLALWPRGSIASDCGLRIGPRSPAEFTVAHNVSTKAEVDLVMQQAERAGASVLKSAHDTAWGGYAGYFQDPDGHLWEVAWNPHWGIKD